MWRNPEKEKAVGGNPAAYSSEQSQYDTPAQNQQAKKSLPTAALAYVAQGIPAIPLHHPVLQNGIFICSCGRKDCKSPAKHPLTPHGLKDATTDPVTIMAWWQRWPQANVGIITGAASGIVVLDIDPRHGGDEALAILERQHGALPMTWRFLTGGGGEHILFRHGGDIISNSAGKIGLGIDLRGDGGYIVAPPSLHISGKHYTISVDHHPDDMPLADVPAWLLGLVQKKEGQKSSVPVSEWRNIVKGVTDGRRNDTITQLAGKLLRHRIDLLMTLELCLSWNEARCNPPLDPAEVSSIVKRIADKELNRRRGLT